MCNQNRATSIFFSFLEAKMLMLPNYPKRLANIGILISVIVLLHYQATAARQFYWRKRKPASLSKQVYLPKRLLAALVLLYKYYMLREPVTHINVKPLCTYSNEREDKIICKLGTTSCKSVHLYKRVTKCVQV